jgi:hypothetical protein
MEKGSENNMVFSRLDLGCSQILHERRMGHKMLKIASPKRNLNQTGKAVFSFSSLSWAKSAQKTNQIHNFHFKGII